VGRPTKAQREASDLALRAHAAAEQDLTPDGYAKAAGITAETASKRAKELGLPISLDGRPAVVFPVRGAPQGVDPDSREKQAADSPLNDVEEAVMDPGSVKRMVQELVREAVNADRGSPQSGTDPTAAAQTAARRRVARQHIESVVQQAETWQTWDEEAGEVIRRAFYDEGLRREFSSPAEMVRTWRGFWWANRDRVNQLLDDREDAVSRIQDLERQLDPYERRRAARDRVYMMIMMAAWQGHPFPPPEMAYLFKVADSEAEGLPLPPQAPPEAEP
jgi:hypothetical protein